MQQSQISIVGLGGDALTAPENTEVAYWAALGGGASGIAIGVRLSKDNQVICSNHDDFLATCNDPRKIGEMDWDDIRRLDAGVTFKSTVLDANNQPTGNQGADTPWQGNLPKKSAIRVPLLNDVLKLFARRCSIILFLPDGQDKTTERTIAELARFGVLNRVQLAGNQKTCTFVRKNSPAARCMLVGDASKSPASQLKTAEKLGTDSLYLDWDSACTTGTKGIYLNPILKSRLEASTVNLHLGSATLPYAATPAHVEALLAADITAAIIARGVLPSVEAVTRPSLVVSDTFEGNSIDRSIWTAGYSHTNQDTEIFQNDGLHIVIKDDGSYSGAAAVCILPVHGRFDARTAFHVDNPRQATTFELAAICIDPGYFRIDNSDLTSRNVNLTFDVHGAPPYASSERDEDDGFRCGWNNGFNLTRIDEDWAASSVNMYNKYGRDVGDGTADNPEGRLRLVRNGPVFSCYYTDKHNEAWVCSGAMLVQNLSEDIFLRLAAKHWSKGGVPPSNHVQFRDFQVYQF